jgi:hypothetical protein
MENISEKGSVEIYNILASGKHFNKYLSKNNLNILERFVFEDLARCRIVHLRNHNPEIKEEVKHFFENNLFPKDIIGWQIYKNVYNSILK